MTRTIEPNTAGHPSPQGVEKYGGIRKIKVVLMIERDIPNVLAERYGIPLSMHIQTLWVEDENGRRIYKDILYAQGGWKEEECVAWGQYEYIDVGATGDIKIADEMIKAIMSQYKPRKGNEPKVPVKIEIVGIDFDWEILKNSEEKLWKFEVFTKVKYYWENGARTIPLVVKFPEGVIDVHPLTKVYWEGWIINSVAEFLLTKNLFDPQTYKGVLDI